MIFICVTKNVKPPVLDRGDGIRFNSKSKQIVYSVSSKKEAFWTPYLESTAEATGVIRTTVAQSYPT